ncbi:ParB/RepB/Spo0J family partition protein [Burkholderia vietnamiensis]|uniref:ParB/RepB/Spo0J family partition protein n=1 Tax=Burkholderia vietnamiensis TaxID=60552 RepID=UPI001CF4CB2B|nr:ParB/RepB/Spo0J family partition protein [Burkholderia vietnamiensis]MCA8270377.1 ParB N-terminal domain-containing protein [Burkholderia vietnamiensis]
MQTNHAELREVAAAVENKIATIPVVQVPLSSLVDSKYNVRKTALTGIEGLAENIKANGQMQNLIVHLQPGRKKKEQYGVAGGRRRRAAFMLLLSKGEIAADHPVNVQIVTEADALVMSMSENTAREAMHPADQIEAFMALVDAGKSAEYIAAIFGLSSITVERRLKLAKASPKLREELAADRITIEQLAALAMTDDHAVQERVWESARSTWARQPAQLRGAVTGDRVRVDTHPLARFVGINEFEAAGGHVMRDLFSDDGDAYIEGGELLHRLAAEKFDKIAADLNSEGWAWVETMGHCDYSYRSKLAKVQPTVGELSEADRAEVAKLTAQRDEAQGKIEAAEREIEQADGDEDYQQIEQAHAQIDALHDQVEFINGQIAEIEDRAKVWPDDVKASAGVLVYLAHDGMLKVERGYVRREDQAQAVSTAGGAVSNLQPEKKKAVHSEKLMLTLSAHQTAAVQAELIAAPNAALAILAHRMSESVLFIGGSYDNPVKVQPQSSMHRLSDVDGMKESDAWKAMDAARAKWKKEMPKQADARLKWLLGQTQEVVIDLLAFCTAATVDGVHGGESEKPLAKIAPVVNLDMSKYWTATADSYFNHVSKARIAEVVKEAVSAEKASEIEGMKKGDAANAAERALRDAGSTWLPTMFRAVAEKRAKKAAAPAAEVQAEAARDDADAAPETVQAWPWPTAAAMNSASHRLAA